MSEPLVLINLFSLPVEMVDTLVANWEDRIAGGRGAKGFRGTARIARSTRMPSTGRQHRPLEQRRRLASHRPAALREYRT